MAVHVGRDKYRVIWQIGDAGHDYEGVADEVVPVYILRIGPKTDGSMTIYDGDRPPSP